MKAIIYIESDKGSEDLLRVFKEIVESLESKQDLIVPGIDNKEQLWEPINMTELVSEAKAVISEQPAPEPIAEAAPEPAPEPIAKAKPEPATKQRECICENCGKPFTTFRSDAKTCSPRCSKYLWFKRNKAKNLPLKECKHCGKEFKPKSNRSLFCSNSCTKLYQYHSKLDKTTRRVPVKDKICKVCGTSFTPGSNHAKYCSPVCSSTAKLENIKSFNKTRTNIITAAKEKQKAEPAAKPEKKSRSTSHLTYFEQPSHIKPEPFKDDKIPLQIDRRTTIMINKNDDPEEARARYLLKHKM